jgi:predicted site-specific integrase-resolvase
MAIELTAQEYADKRGINVSHVQRYSRKGMIMPGVKQVKRFGKTYVLVMKKNYEKEI